MSQHGPMCEDAYFLFSLCIKEVCLYSDTHCLIVIKYQLVLTLISVAQKHTAASGPD